MNKPPWKSCALEGLPKKDGEYLVTVKMRSPEQEQKDLRWVMQLTYWMEDETWVFLPDWCKVVAYMLFPKEYRGR